MKLTQLGPIDKYKYLTVSITVVVRVGCRPEGQHRKANLDAMKLVDSTSPNFVRTRRVTNWTWFAGDKDHCMRSTWTVKDDNFGIFGNAFFHFTPLETYIVLEPFALARCCGS